MPQNFKEIAELTTEELIAFHVAQFEDLIPTKEEALRMLAHLGLNENSCFRKACWGEVIFDRTRAMTMIRAAA